MSSVNNNNLISKTFNYHKNQVRAFSINGSVWFYGNDIARCLGYKKPRNAILVHVDNEDRQSLSYQSALKQGGRKLLNLWTGINRMPKQLINESGVYALIFGSKLPSARKFKHWVTHDVLPSIRKTGSYHKPMSLTDRLLQRDKEEITLLRNNKQQQKQIQQMTPDAKLGRAITVARTNISINSFSKILKQNGVNLGPYQLFDWLRTHGYLMNYGSNHNIPYQRYINQGLFVVHEYHYKNIYGDIHLNLTTRITPKGQRYFINKLV